MGRTRMIAKSCPKCEQHVAVASKTCKCGYSFFNARRVQRDGPIPEVDERRRTGRVRREKPNFYDSQQFDKKKKRKKRAKQLAEADEKQSKKETAAVRAKRRQKRKEDLEGEDLASKLPKQKQDLAAIILGEINRKIGIVEWKPDIVNT